MKNNYAIEVKNLSKKYIINENKEPYSLLRDEIGNFFNNFKTNNRTNTKNRSFWALDDVTFSVEQGEILGIIGPNGAGKSTLLKILSEITYPTGGEATLRGRVSSMLEVGTGFNPELTGRENIYLNGSILGMSRSEIRQKIDEIIDFSEVRNFIDEPVKHYSSGMYVRLAFSVAAFLESDILLIDEVLSVGDASFQKKSLGKVNKITQNREKTIIFVSHDLNAIAKLCSKVILINNGKLVKYGKSSDVIKHYLTSLTKGELYEENFIDLHKRMGTHEIYIEKVEIVDGKGKKLSTLKSGDPFRFRIHYKLKPGQTIEKLMVGIFMKTEWDAPVFEQQNILEGVNFGDITKEGFFEFSMDKFPIAPGTYYINCSFIKNNGIGGQYFDNYDNILKFEVGRGDFFGTNILPTPDHGSVYLRGKWSHKLS